MTSRLDRIRFGKGFIAALDQSGRSAPTVLSQYGIPHDAYHGDGEMFDLLHGMRSRILCSPAFTGERIIGVILHESTLDRDIMGVGSVPYLWEKKRVVSFLRIDDGLTTEVEGVEPMRPISELPMLLDRGRSKGVIGTKQRTVIRLANQAAIRDTMDHQFEIAEQVLSAGLYPIVEPEVDINSPEKAEAESLLRTCLLERLDALSEGSEVLMKLTLPSVDDFYQSIADHPKVLRLAALSGGYPRRESILALGRNHGMIASFSRALMEGLSVHQTDQEFDSMLHMTIRDIYEASQT